MKRIYSADVPREEGKKVKVAGWVRRIRDLGSVKFLLLADQKGSIQLTAKRDQVSNHIFDLISKLRRESTISVEGEVEVSEKAPGGRELIPTKINVLTKAEPQLPLEISGRYERAESKLPQRLDWRSLDLRKPANQAIVKIQAALVRGMKQWLDQHDFIQVFTPCIVGSASEGGADMFPIVYFDQEAFLRQDPQLHRELTIASGLDRIYDLGPSWRAEPSHTPRHLCEFNGCAVEIGFIKSEQEVMRLEEKIIKSALKKAKKCKRELKLLDQKIELPEMPFPEIRFPEVYDRLQRLGKKLPRGRDLDREAQKLLAKWAAKEYRSNWLWINRFPFKSKPFYVRRDKENPELARSVDLLYKGIEQSSGGQRENRYNQLIRNIKEKKLDLKRLEWFTKFFKYGVPPLGGFNLGIERLLMPLLGLDNIREASLFPRTPERMLP